METKYVSCNIFLEHLFVMIKEVAVRSYGRMELAQLYSPSLTSRAAWRKLQGWMGSYPKLYNRLAEIGYQKSQRSFTPQQVQLIFEALGEP